MPKNILKTKKGNFGKVDKLLAKPEIRTERTLSEKDLNAELGHKSSIPLGSVKREEVKLGT